MDISGHHRRSELIRAAGEIALGLDEQGTTDAAGAIRNEITKLKEGTFVLTVMGLRKRGKSTLINALLGRTDDLVAPVDKLPASSTITRYRWATSDSATVTYRDGRRESIRFAQIRDFVTELGNPNNQKGVEVVDVSGPFGSLDPSVMIVDSPGAGSVHEHHEAILHGIIPQSDAVLFLVSVNLPIDKDEFDLLREIKSEDIRRVVFAVNKVDDAQDPQDIEDAIQHNQELLRKAGIDITVMHQISALQAFRGELSRSGFVPLLDELRTMFVNEKGKALAERFVARVQEVAGPPLQLMEQQLELHGRSEGELSALEGRLAAAKSAADLKRPVVELEFTSKWGDALNRFERRLTGTRDAVIEEVKREIADTKTLDVSGLASRMPSRLQNIIEERLKPLATELEAALRSAVSELDATFPSVELVPSGGVDIQVKEDRKPLIKSIAWTTVALMAPAVPGAIAGTIPYVGWLLGFGVTALAAPVGFALFGLAALTIPFSYRTGKIKLRDDLDRASREQIRAVFEKLRIERIDELKAAGKEVLGQYRVRLSKEVLDLELALADAKLHRHSGAQLDKLRQDIARVRSALARLAQDVEQTTAQSTHP